jgi:hypothetical protein
MQMFSKTIAFLDKISIGIDNAHLKLRTTQ